MYSITENIYYSQLSPVALLLQLETVSRRIIQGKDRVLSPYVLSSCGLSLPSTCLLVTVNEARSYFASTIPGRRSLVRVTGSGVENNGLRQNPAPGVLGLVTLSGLANQRTAALQS
jgi:hypothetical protein